MINLLPAISDLEKQKAAIMAKRDAEIKELDDAIAVLRHTNQACWGCGGKGWNLRRRACAEDDRPDEKDPRDRETCRMCHGTGIKHWDGEAGEMTIDLKSGEAVPARQVAYIPNLDYSRPSGDAPAQEITSFHQEMGNSYLAAHK